MSTNNSDELIGLLACVTRTKGKKPVHMHTSRGWNTWQGTMHWPDEVAITDTNPRQLR